jgi:hypothetical protein
MKTEMDINTIIKNGMEALREKLNPVEMALFFRYYNLGEGDYTKERRQWLDKLTLDGIIGDIEGRRTGAQKTGRALDAAADEHV